MPNRLLALIRRAASPDGDADADLVARYAAHRDAAAFAGLVRRHGGLVWAVCRDHLPTEADAEDAFQAVWVALARHAGRVRRPAAVAGWLHAVAVRVCGKARRAAERRRKHEFASGGAMAQGADAPRSPGGRLEWHELAAAVHAEVDRLPARERAVFVLVALEGVRQTDAADRLGIKLNTVSGLLARGRQRVLAGLARKGLAPAAGLAAVTTGCQPPAALVQLATSGADVSATVLELARGAVGVSVRVKLMAAAMTVGVGVGAAWLATAGAQQYPPGSGSGGGPPGGFPFPGGSGSGAPGGPGIGGPPTGAGGFPGGMGPSGGTQNPVGGPKSEYQVADLATNTTAAEFQRLLNARSAVGWEYAGWVQLGVDNKDAGQTRTGHAVFKRPAPVPVLPGMPGMGGRGGAPEGAGGGIPPGMSGPGGGGEAGPGNVTRDSDGVRRFLGRAVPKGTELFKHPINRGDRLTDMAVWHAPRNMDADDIFLSFELKHLKPADLLELGLRGVSTHEMKGMNLLGLIGKPADVEAGYKKLKRLDDAAGGNR